MTITVFIRYQLDPYKRDGFEAYARNWLKIIPKCGGEVVGYWMPHEGTDNIAYGLISFASLGGLRGLPGAAEVRQRRRRQFCTGANGALHRCPRSARSCGKWSERAAATLPSRLRRDVVRPVAAKRGCKG